MERSKVTIGQSFQQTIVLKYLMLYTKCNDIGHAVPKKEVPKGFLPYMDLAVILVTWAKLTSDSRIFSCFYFTKLYPLVLRNELNRAYFGTFKMPILMFNSILVFRPEGQIWNPVRRDTRIYVRRILNASRISKTQLNSCTISPN